MPKLIVMKGDSKPISTNFASYKSSSIGASIVFTKISSDGSTSNVAIVIKWLIIVIEISGKVIMKSGKKTKIWRALIMPQT